MTNTTAEAEKSSGGTAGAPESELVPLHNNSAWLNATVLAGNAPEGPAVIHGGPVQGLPDLDHSKLIPPTGPYWPGDPNVVPSPTYLRDNRVLGAAVFTGSHLWPAVVASYAAVAADNRGDRDNVLKTLTNRKWVLGYVHAHSAQFQGDNNGTRSVDQFYVGLLLVPSIRRDLMSFAFVRSAMVQVLGWTGWAADRYPAGECYLNLAPVGTDLALMRATLGSYPTVGALRHWFNQVGSPWPGPFLVRKTERPGVLHVVLSAEQDHCLVQFPGGTVSGVTELDHADRLGGDEVGPALDDALSGTHDVRIVCALDGTKSLCKPFEQLRGVRKYTEVWGSVKLLSVVAQVSVIGDGTTKLYLGIAGPAARRRLPAATAEVPNPDMLPAHVTLLEAYNFIDCTATHAGENKIVVEPPLDRVDNELSALRVPVGLHRPDLYLLWQPDRGATATLVINLRVGGGAHEGYVNADHML